MLVDGSLPSLTRFEGGSDVEASGSEGAGAGSASSSKESATFFLFFLRRLASASLCGGQFGRGGGDSSGVSSDASAIRRSNCEQPSAPELRRASLLARRRLLERSALVDKVVELDQADGLRLQDIVDRLFLDLIEPARQRARAERSRTVKRPVETRSRAVSWASCFLR